VAFLLNGMLVVSASDRTVRLWDLATGTVRYTFGNHLGEVRAVAFLLDGKLVAFASRGFRARAARCTLKGHSGLVLACYGTVRLWDSATRAARCTFDDQLGEVRAVAFSLDGKLVASTSSDKTVRLWDSATGVARRTLESHSGDVTAVAFSPVK